MNGMLVITDTTGRTNRKCCVCWWHRMCWVQVPDDLGKIINFRNSFTTEVPHVGNVGPYSAQCCVWCRLKPVEQK
jgi:hypothetical protein